MDAMDRHHYVRQCAFDLLDAVGAPTAVVAVVDVCGDKLLSGESSCRRERVQTRSATKYRTLSLSASR